MSAQDFDLQVQTWILEAIAKKPLMSFSDLVNKLPGVNPSEIARGIRKLGNVALSSDTPRRPQTHKKQVVKLPVPHPLDYDWRFTADTVSYLFNRIDRFRLASPTLCFLGAPTLFRAAQETEIRSSCHLIDASEASATALRKATHNTVFVTDLTSGDLPAVHANIVVADPPWYEELTKSFLWAAAQIVESQGFVLLSFPPVGTRPLIEEEWERVERFSKDLGLIVREKETTLKYESPPFEQNAMKAAQHEHIHSDWRPGVLVVFEKTGECRVSRPVVRAEQERWIEQSLLGIRWKFRCSQAQTGGPVMTEIVPGDILDSVSRRDPRRVKADVWTSGNRIYSCENTQQLALITQALQAGIRPDTCVANSIGRKLGEDEARAVTFAAKRIVGVTAQELQEYLLSWGG